MSTTEPQSSTPQTFTCQKPPQPQYYCFRGHKKRLSQLIKTKMLKTKRLKQKEQKVLRYDNDEDEFIQLEGQKTEQVQARREQASRAQSQRRVKSQFQIMKLSPMQKLQRMHRNKSSTDNHQLMIRTSRMQIIPVDTTPRNNMQKNIPSTSLPPEEPHITKFYSRNLQQRMNEYLNMVVAKSSHDHNEKVKKMKEQDESVADRIINKEKETKIFMKNKFLRELKTRVNLIKKNHSGSSHSQYAQQTIHYNNTSRHPPQTFRSSHNHSTSRQRQTPLHNSQQYTHSRINSNHQNIHNHSTGNGKMADGEELINFASEVLSKSMKVYGTGKSRVKENSFKRLNCSVQVANR